MATATMETKEEEVIKYTCGECKETFVRSHNLEKHMARCHGAPVKCDKCGVLYASQKSYKDHIYRKRCFPTGVPLVTYKCDQCYKRYDIKQSLDKHKAKHRIDLTPRDYACVGCDQRFTTQKRLDNHIVLKHVKHSLPPPPKERVACTKCDDTFASVSGRNRHYKQKHVGYDDNGGPCLFCGSHPTTNSNLRRHLMTCPNRPAPLDLSST
jgi:predicted RNA-binding Zn-ribbon protein involved in translation (DUF1610 family)